MRDRALSRGGGGGIRTLGTVARTTVFETARFNHSRTPPRRHAKGSGSCRRSLPRMDDATLERFADLVVGFGANVQPGPDRRDRLRAGQGGARARARGERLPARREVRRRQLLRPARQARADRSTRAEDTLDFVPPWYGERMLALGEQRAARDRALRARPRPGCSTTSTPCAPGATSCPAVKEAGKVVNDRTTNWTIVPVPDAGLGAARATPTSTPDEALARARASSSCTSAGSTRTTRSPPGASAPTRSSAPPSG